MFNLRRIIVKKLKRSSARRYSKVTKDADDISKIRNIGILAHIDAGKTTTTERMLYYSGKIRQMGEVHHGNTVTDYMEQERERGITITSAAVTFNWKKHQFNLIDTPGHIDFTMEVERTLNVLDGAIVILDGSAGVEAQTLTVWRQADRYTIPRIIFLNKMDRVDANILMCCASIEQKLEKPTLCLQIPLYEDKKLIGLIDVMSIEKLLWDSTMNVTRTNLTEKGDGKAWEMAVRARTSLIDKLSGHDDGLAETIISQNSLDNIKTVEIVNALQRVTLHQKAMPVLCGSAYKNIGIQPLMDAVVLYLPPPVQTSQQYSHFGNDLCARAFKVLHDKHKGPLVFFRIYTGQFSKTQKIYNISRECSEQVGKLYVAYADDFKEVEAVTNGNIAVISGLKVTMTGDLITNSQAAAQRASKALAKKTNRTDTPDGILGLTAKVPEPVFFCSIEPPSLAAQAALDQALIQLQREDPSFRVTHNAETGQTVLAGMGELHLEIIKDRLLKEYKIDADLGPLQIAYREAPIAKVTEMYTHQTKIGNSKQLVTVRLTLLPTTEKVKDVLRLDKSPDAASNIANIFHKHLLAVRQGIEVGLSHGPKIHSQVINCQVMLHMLEVGKGTTESMIAATVTQLIQKLLNMSGTNILEPVMSLEVVTPEEYSSAVLADLSRRRCEIKNVTVRGNSKVILSETPLSELLGFSTVLRTISSGTATFTMEFSEYKKMTVEDEMKALQNVRGF